MIEAPVGSTVTTLVSMPLPCDDSVLLPKPRAGWQGEKTSAAGSSPKHSGKKFSTRERRLDDEKSRAAPARQRARIESKIRYHADPRSRSCPCHGTLRDRDRARGP